MKPIKVILIIFTLLIGFNCAIAQDDTSGGVFQTNSNVQFPQDNDIADAKLDLPAFNPIELSPQEVIFNQVSRTYSSIDPVITTGFYPGGRGPNKLIIYTPQYGTHTGTNEFGTEAVVTGNIVTELSGAHPRIPDNGLVIRGRGSAKNWIAQTIKIGSKIYINTSNNTITAYTTSDSFTYDARTKINDALSIVGYYSTLMPDYNAEIPQNYIQSAKNYLQLAQNSKQNLPELKQYCQEAINAANMAIKSAMPYIKDELKGVWIRPTETSKEQIIATLDKLKDSGFNNVFLETYYHGKTIFPSKTMNKYGFTVQNEQFTGFDPLEVWISEAHKRGIKVHTWFQSFYVGNENPSLNPTSILSVRPAWGNKTKQFASYPGATKSVSEHNGYFLDPANPEVQTFLEELVTEIITDYKPDGINLDYIRYPNSNPRNDKAAWGFTEYARNSFKAIYGKDPVELNTSDALWYDWNEYRRNNVTNFVQKIGQIGKDNKTYISAVIFPDFASALASKQQDWSKWSTNNYVDGFTPLFLTYDSKMLASMMNDVMSVKSKDTDLYAGLFVTFMGGPSEDLIKQIFEARKMKVNGIILFDYAHTTPVYTTALMAGAFNPAIASDYKVAQKKKRLWSKKEKKSSCKSTSLNTKQRQRKIKQKAQTQKT